MSSILKVDTIQDQSGNNIINESGNVITIGASGDTITVPAGASLVTGGDISTGNNGSIFILDSVGQKSAQITNDSSSSNSLQIDADPDNSGADTYMQFKIDDSEKVRITSAGSVGIGLSVPEEKLHVNGTVKSLALQVKSVNNEATLKLQNSTTGGTSTDGFYLQAYLNDVYVANRENGDMFFRTNNTDRLKIENDGKVGIGTTSPSSTLDVNGTITANGLHMSDNEYIRQGDSSPQEFEIFTSGSNTSIRSPGSASHSIALKPGGGGSILITNSSSQNIITQQADSAYLHFAGSTKLNTTTNGVRVTGGIVFGSATDNDANQLDDYEEGSWTPANPNISLSEAYGRYTKIGNLVTIRGSVVIPTTSDSNQFTLSGLPFTVSNTDANVQGNISLTTIGTDNAYLVVVKNNTTMRLVNNINQAIANSACSGDFINFSVAYTV